MTIRLNEVTVRFSGLARPALDSVNLVHEAGCLTVLGPHGSGKSTLLAVVASRVLPTAGTVSVGPHDAARDPLAVRAAVGYVPQSVALPRDLSLREYLVELARLDGLGPEAAARVDAAMAAVHLSDVDGRRLRDFSGGMKRRALIAQALMKDPAVLVIDTPTAGLDPYEQLMTLELVRSLAVDRPVLLATTVVDEVSELGGAVAVLDRGRLIRRVPAGELALAAEGRIWELPWSFRGRLDGLVVPGPRPDTVAVLADAPPHQVARLVDPTPEYGYLVLLWNSRRERQHA
jgi:ABC-2 type transport system ATP-binding protein